MSGIERLILTMSVYDYTYTLDTHDTRSSIYNKKRKRTLMSNVEHNSFSKEGTYLSLAPTSTVIYDQEPAAHLSS